MKLILFSGSALAVTQKSNLNGGSAYAKKILDHLLRCEGDFSVVLYYFANEELPEDIRQFSKCSNISIVQLHQIDELNSLIAEYASSVNFVCMPNLSVDYGILKVNKNICSVFGFRGVEMPTDTQEILYAQSLREYVVYFLKKIFTDAYVEYTRKKIVKFHNKNRFDTIICNTEHTRYILSSVTNSEKFNCEKVRVLYSPRIVHLKQCVTKSYNAESYYLILMGNRWSKNAIRAIQVLQKVYASNENWRRTVVLGMNESEVNEYRRKYSKRFNFLSYVSSEEYESYIKNAHLLIYPSLNEGFGYPPLHAMAYGVPVIASGLSAIPEICGDSALYFNPYSKFEIESRIRYFEDKGNWERYSNACMKHQMKISIMQDNHLNEHLQEILDES